MSLTVRQFREQDSTNWDSFCGESFQGTFLHTRRFLSYHGDRFEDQSLIIEDDGRWVGILPAGRPGQIDSVISHPGITYGGILHRGGLFGSRMIEALNAISSYYTANGVTKLVYKVVPSFYHRVLAQDDLYALFRLGAVRTRCDLSSTVDLVHRRMISERRRRGQRRALRSGIEIVEGREWLREFWTILEANLERRHQTKPVHSIAEIEDLNDRFPTAIRCLGALAEGRIVAGTLLFVTDTTIHAQYIAASEDGFQLSALDALFEYVISSAKPHVQRWFDFGTSNELGGQVLNDGLYTFKTEFGGGGTVYETYELDLKQ
jgi:hypothetical protein